MEMPFSFLGVDSMAAPSLAKIRVLTFRAFNISILLAEVVMEN